MPDIERIKGNIKSMIDQGAPEADIDAYLGHEGVTIADLTSKKVVKEKPVPQWGREHPNLYGAVGAARETLGPVAEALGLGVGGLLGSTGGLIGSVAGAGLGYGGVRQGLSALDVALGNKQDSGMIEAAKQSAKDIATGAELEAGGQIAGAGMQKLIDYAPRLYESALKPSTTLKQAARMKRVGTALEEGIPVTKGGLAKSKATVKEINDEIKTRLQGYAEETIDTHDALRPVRALKAKAITKNINPKDDLATINKYITDIEGEINPITGETLVEASQPEKIPILQAQSFKQTLNKELDQYYKLLNQGKIVPATALAQTKAAMADGLRTEITRVFPEIQALNAREASLIELNKSLERAVNRISNRELIPLLTGIAFSGKSPYSLTKAILIKLVEHPEIKSRLAIALHNATPLVAESAVKAVGSAFNAMPSVVEDTLSEFEKASPEKRDLMYNDTAKKVRKNWKNMSDNDKERWRNANSASE